MRYKLIIFDFDGTLADSFPWFLRVFNQLAVEFHFTPMNGADHDLLRGYNTRQLLAHFQIPIWKVPRIAARMRAWSARDAGEIPLIPDMTDVLRKVRQQGTCLALVTSNSEQTVRQILGVDNFALFDQIECGVSLLGKTARLRRVVCRAGIEAGKAIYIGDEIRDADAARGAAMPFGAVAWGYTRLEALLTQSPAAAFREPGDILSL